jgi:hypothetical protein
MYNWSTDETELKKDPEQYAIWRLEQLINYGLGDEKISEQSLKKYWHKISMDPETRKYLKFLLWPS